MSARRIRLLLFATDFRFGGTERHLVTLAKSLDPTRFDVRIACFRAEGEFRRQLDDSAIPISTYPIRSLYGLDCLHARFNFARDLVRQRIDVVDAFGFYPALFAVPEVRVARVRLVVSIRDNGDLWTPTQRRLLRVASRLADRVLVNARIVRSRLVGEGYDRSRIEVIPNGIDLARFHPGGGRHSLRREFDLPRDAALVGVVARLNRSGGVEIKGIRHFLEAAALVAREREDVRFLVVGEGNCRAELEARARELGLSSRVVFTGFRFDVAGVLSELAVAAVPSLTEATSNSLLEAMAVGVPVVATRVGGNPEVVDDGVTGLIVPPSDSAALASAIGRVLDDPALALRLARAERRRIETRYSLDRMIDATQRAYASVVEHALPARPDTRTASAPRAEAGP